MTQPAALEPLYILHTRPFRNTSLIAEILTQSNGKVAVVAKSARGPKSRYKGMLQAFSPLCGIWKGNGELKFLNQLERNGAIYPLDGQALICGFYLNEILVRLLERDDPCHKIFPLYENTLKALCTRENLARPLRYFEKQLLETLGYGIEFNIDYVSREPIKPNKQYHYNPDIGFSEALEIHNTIVFAGESIIKISQEDFTNPEILKAAKQLFRLALAPHLGSKPLMSRSLL